LFQHRTQQNHKTIVQTHNKRREKHFGGVLGIYFYNARIFTFFLDFFSSYSIFTFFWIFSLPPPRESWPNAILATGSIVQHFRDMLERNIHLWDDPHRDVDGEELLLYRCRRGP
jgi:hypothetical protein